MTNPNKGNGSSLIYIVLLAIGIIAGGTGVYLFTHKDGAMQNMEASPTSPTAKAEKKVKYWHAPMDPTYIRNEPGKSPMGMDLVPVYESIEAEMEPGMVLIDPVTIQNIGVRTKRAEKKRLTKNVRTVGIVDYDEKRVHHVNTKIEGWVEKLFVDFTGEEVKKDDYLLEIYSPRLVATQEEYLLAKSYQEKTKSGIDMPGSGSVLELAKKRLELWDVPAHQIRELEESGEIKRSIHVHSPVSGVVIKKAVQQGMFVKPGMTLYTIADLKKVWVYADIYEYELSWIKVGQEAEITLVAYPGSVFKGRVAFINPFMEPKTRTVKVRLEFDNFDGRLKPDMFANVLIKSRGQKVVVVVPVEAVLLSGERSVVVVSRGNGKFMPREVRLGIEAEGYYEIKDGIDAGDEVVTSAHFLIDSESRLKEAISKMLELNEEIKTPEKEKEEQETDHSKMKEMDHSNMEGMDHSNMEGMDHGSMERSEHEGMSHD